MTDKKKFVKSVERKGGMIEVKNTGKGQAQGQAVKINIDQFWVSKLTLELFQDVLVILKFWVKKLV